MVEMGPHPLLAAFSSGNPRFGPSAREATVRVWPPRVPPCFGHPETGCSLHRPTHVRPLANATPVTWTHMCTRTRSQTNFCSTLLHYFSPVISYCPYIHAIRIAHHASHTKATRAPVGRRLHHTISLANARPRLLVQITRRATCIEHSEL